MSQFPHSRETVADLPEFPWTVERYHAAIAAGVLNENDRIELLFGKLVPMSPIGFEHGKVVNKINRLFAQRLDWNEHTIGIQNPITLVDDSEPEPDIYVARGPLEAYDRHPTPDDLLLVIEVADTTIHRDRGIKRYAYAVAGIQEYWIINLYEKQIERYTDPHPADGTYRSSQILHRGNNIDSLHLGRFTVNDLLVE